MFKALIEALALVALAASAPAWAARTVVSLTFDDGRKTQLIAAQILAARALPATFYINSGPLGSSGFYMTLDEARSLVAQGHEVGGHSLTHPDLTRIAATSVPNEICADRQNLLAWGFNPVSFAYPYGHFTPGIEDVARQCGYQSARGITGVPPSESTTPPKRYAMRAVPAIAWGQTAADFERVVEQAQASGGGWVIFIFHSICDTQCYSLATRPADIAAFADWLAARRGDVEVRTVGSVMSGGADAGHARAFPNPWRADKHNGLAVTIDGMGAGSEVRIYSASGKLVQKLPAPGGSAAWDLRDGSGARVGSGIYLYLVTDAEGKTASGVVGVTR